MARRPGPFECALAVALLAWGALFVHRSRVFAWPGEARRVSCLFDDAMVSMRYAENLVKGEGLVWNPGEWVEGYVNFSWVLVMAVVRQAAGDRALACLAMQGVGLLAMALVGLATWRLAVALTGSLWVARGAAFLAVSYYPLLYLSLMGMETGFAAFLVTAAALQAVARASEPRVFVAWPLLLSLAILARPDLAIVGAVFLVIRWVSLERGQKLPIAAAEGLLLAAPVAAHLLWRRATYGAWLPNPYVLKVEGLPLALRLENGVGYSIAYWQTLAVPALLLLAGLRTGLARPLRLLLPGILAMHLYQLWVGGDPWPLWRFVCPVLPMVWILVAEGARRLAGAMDGEAAPLGRKLVAAGWVLAAFLGLHFDTLANFRLGWIYQRWSNQVNVWAAEAVRRTTSGSASVACFWAGTVPFYSGRRGVDFLGKTDPEIARRPPDVSGAVGWDRMRSVPGHNKYDLRWTLSARRPDAIADARVVDGGVSWGRDRLEMDRAFLRAFRKMRPADLPASAPIVLWVRKGSPRILWDRLEPAPGKTCGGMSSTSRTPSHRIRQ